MANQIAQRALERAIAAAGGQAALGRALGVSQPTIHDWLHGTKRVPAERVLAVEEASGVSRHELRPDIYPLEAAVAASRSEGGRGLQGPPSRKAPARE